MTEIWKMKVKYFNFSGKLQKGKNYFLSFSTVRNSLLCLQDGEEIKKKKKEEEEFRAWDVGDW